MAIALCVSPLHYKGTGRLILITVKTLSWELTHFEILLFFFLSLANPTYVAPWGWGLP